MKIGELLLIFNQENELIAISKAQIEYNTWESLKSKDIIAQTLLDKGYYLRKKQ